MYKIDKYLPQTFFTDLVPQSDLHDLNLDWILHKMRKYEYVYYKLMDIINDAIEGKLDELLYNKIMALLGFVNVVNPPAPLEGLDKTGESDNSEKLNNIFQWLVDNGQCLLYFPSGVYSISNITVPEGIVIIGECKHDTVISVTGAGRDALFKNTLTNVTIANISFKGNIQNQSTNLVCFGCPVNDVTLCNINIIEFYRALEITSNGGYFRADMLDISGCSNGAIKISTFVRDEFLCYPDNFVDPTTIYNFDKMIIGELLGNTVGDLIINNTDYLTMTNIEIQDTRSEKMIVDSSSWSTYDFICNVREWNRTLINMTGEHMYYNWRGIVTFKGTDYIFYKTKSYNVESSENVIINTNTMSIASHTKNDYAGGAVYEHYAQQTTTISDNLHTNVMGSAFINLEGDSVIDSHNNLNVHVMGDYNQNTNRNFTNNVSGSANYSANTIALMPELPLTYNKKPVEYGIFKYIPMRDMEGNEYKVLVDYDTESKIPEGGETTSSNGGCYIYGGSITLYVDPVNGDDSTVDINGTFKTIDKALFTLSSKGFTQRLLYGNGLNVVISVSNAANKTLEINNKIRNISLSISLSRNSNCTLVFNNFDFINCNVTIDSCNVNIATIPHIYNSELFFTNVTFMSNNNIYLYKCNVSFYNCFKVPHGLVATGSSLQINQCTIALTNIISANNQSGLKLTNSYFYNTGLTCIWDSTIPSNPWPKLMTCINSVITFTDGATILNNSDRPVSGGVGAPYLSLIGTTIHIAADQFGTIGNVNTITNQTSNFIN